jgi:hypothetical protein
MTESDVKQLQAAFKLVCKKCGSTNVVMDADPGFCGTEETGWISGTLSIGCIGCNDCKQNDLHLDN